MIDKNIFFDSSVIILAAVIDDGIVRVYLLEKRKDGWADRNFKAEFDIESLELTISMGDEESPVYSYKFQSVRAFNGTIKRIESKWGVQIR